MTSDSAAPDGFVPSNYRILVVDDDDALRNLMKFVLGRDGFQVETAPDGVVGLRILESHEFDLLILDDMMPELDGVEMLRRIRADARWDNTPVIMWSIRELGADAHLTKPCLAKQITDTVRDLLVHGRRSPARE